MNDPAVFISYATPDKTCAGLVCQALEQRLIPCWIAPRNVPVGDNAFNAIPAAIEGCTVLVLILSSKSNLSKHVTREVQLALDHNKPIVPFRIEDIKPEHALAYILTGVEWLDAFVGPVERHLAPLVDCVEGILKVRKPGMGGGSVAVGPAKELRRGWIAGLGLALAVLAGAAVMLFQQFAPKDGTVHKAVAERLLQSLSGRGISVDCAGCSAQQAHVNVQVEHGRVALSGAASAQDISAIQAVPLDLSGVKSVAYALEAIQPAVPQPNSLPAPSTSRVSTNNARPEKAGAAPAQAPAAELTAEQLRAKAYVLTGEEKMRAQEYLSAENNFQMALNLDPDNTAARKGLSAAKKALGD
jgi:hypothetical protein